MMTKGMMIMKIIRTYSELMEIKTFKDRFEYLKLNGTVCGRTFGGDRYLNQMLYKSDRWKKVRRDVIVRDNGFDLSSPGVPIPGYVYIHHMNPINADDILHDRDYIYDPEFLISCAFYTHQAIHYGDEHLLPTTEIVERHKNDTCPWRREKDG